MTRGTRRTDEEMTEEQRIARAAYERYKAKKQGTTSRPIGTRIALPGDIHVPMYTYLVWIDGIAHQTKQAPITRITQAAHVLMLKLVNSGQLTSKQRDAHMERVRSRVESVNERKNDNDESIKYIDDPRDALLEFLPGYVPPPPEPIKERRWKQRKPDGHIPFDQKAYMKEYRAKKKLLRQTAVT